MRNLLHLFGQCSQYPFQITKNCLKSDQTVHTETDINLISNHIFICKYLIFMRVFSPLSDYKQLIWFVSDTKLDFCCLSEQVLKYDSVAHFGSFCFQYSSYIAPQKSEKWFEIWTDNWTHFWKSHLKPHIHVTCIRFVKIVWFHVLLPPFRLQTTKLIWIRYLIICCLSEQIIQKMNLDLISTHL